MIDIVFNKNFIHLNIDQISVKCDINMSDELE